MTLLLAGLALRLIIAYVLFPGSGFESDTATFTAWARSLAEHGPGNFYASGEFADYPPGYLYVLWPLGLLGQLLAPLAGGDAGAVTAAMIKLPAILADLAVGYVLYRVVLAWWRDRAHARRLAVLAAALYLFNPVTAYDSALWGQTDAAGALVMVLGVALLVKGRPEAAFAAAVVAALVKPQFGVVLGPLVVAVLLKRHLFDWWRQRAREASEPSEATTPRALWIRDPGGPLRLVTSAALGALLFFALLAPFSLDLGGFLRLVANTAGGYPYLSVNAYNPWALLGSGGRDSLAAGGGWSYDSCSPELIAEGCDASLLGPVSGLPIGTILLAVGFLVGLWRIFRSDDRRTVVLVAAYLSVAFFMLPTRVHERYLFPAFAFLPLLAVIDRRWLWATAALALGSLMNLHGVLTTPLYATANLEGLPLGDFARSGLGVTLSVMLHVGVFGFLAWQLRRGAAGETAPDESQVAPAVVDRRRAGIGRAARPIGGGPAAVSLYTAVGPREPRSAKGARALGRFTGRSWRRDRSAQLGGERPGRIDRWDLFLLALVFLSALTLRTWRLSEPYGMHFDEVYHARTATEFLQFWRYGIRHDIYEYTHPHLAKYVIAAGLVAFGDDRVKAQSSLGVSVSAADLEPRWSPEDDAQRRNGDRMYLATGQEIRVYDLRDRSLTATLPTPAVALTVDASRHVLYAADAAGQIFSVQTSTLDALRADPAGAPDPTLRLVGSLGPGAGRPVRLALADESGATLMVLLPRGLVTTIDTQTGETRASATIPGAADVEPVHAAARVVATPADVPDPTAAASVLAEILRDEETRIRSLLLLGQEKVTLAPYVTSEQSRGVQAAIDDGRLAGVAVETGQVVAIAATSGVSFRDIATLNQISNVSLRGPATGMAAVTEGLDEPTLYVATGQQLETVKLPTDAAPSLGSLLPMPGVVSDVSWNAATGLVHAAGRTGNGTSATVYVVEPHGNAVFADAALPFDPRAVLLDVQPSYPTEDRQEILALAADGRLASVDVGHNAFAWRIPGVIAGALMAVCLYLLGRFLFRRRSVALIASLLALADGMFFANARIAMNDTYVALFIVAAFTVFTPLYLGAWRSRRAVALGLPLIGLLLGLALASKWVGAYAMGGMVLLILLRSALGRLIALAGMIALTGVLGYLAMTAKEGIADPQRNVLFLLIMLALTVLLAVAIVVRPVRLTLGEVRYATLVPLTLGALAVAVGAAAAIGRWAGLLAGGRLLLAGVALMALGAAIYGAARLAGRAGFGPLAAERAVDAPIDAPVERTRSWLLPGWARGVPWTWALLCLTLVPLAVYVLSYAPWVALGNRWLEGFPKGNTGQLFLDLQKSMYDYHNDLRAAHAASSPWWAWPLDLKPVWFYQDDFANGTTGAIHDAGNLVIFWLAIPAVAWSAYQAWRRRSPSLTLVTLAVASLWLPWARIDRATFQYHVFTTLPFAVLALAYLLAELWHGPSPRTWLLAKVAAATAIVGAPLLWLARAPLCGLAGTEKVNPNGQGCGTVSEQLVVTDSGVLTFVIVALAVALVAWQLVRLASEHGAGGARALPGPLARILEARLGTIPRYLPLALTLAAAALAILVVQLLAPGRVVSSAPVGDPTPFALVAFVLLAVVAAAVLLARDTRRFVVGVVGAAALWFVVWYPYISGLPLPTTLLQKFQLTLPTYNYAFQFAVNTDEPYKGGVINPSMLLLLGVVLLLVLAAMYAAHTWRLELAARRATRALPATGGDTA